jgi:hypothetical protein
VADVAGLGATHDRHDESVWVAQLGPGAMAARERAAMASPATYQQALAQGHWVTDALYGPNQVAGASTASLWWFYADALAGSPPDPTTLGQGVISLVDTHLGAVVTIGRHLNALNKAGALIGDGSAVLLWAGNLLSLLADEPPRRPSSRGGQQP